MPGGELVPKLRVVRCPKCRLLLPEPPGYDVYKCGGCGTALQAKKPKNVAVKSESSVQETDAAHRNTLDQVSKGQQCSNRENLVPSREDSLKSKASTSYCSFSSSSSGDSYLDRNIGRDNDQYDGDQLVPVNLSEDQELESELDIYQLTHRRHRVSQICSNNNSHSENEMDNGILLEGSKEKLICATDEDGNNDKSAQIEVNPELEITEGDLEGKEEFRNGNLSLEGEEEKFNSDSDGEDANKDSTTLAGANPEVEISRSGLEGEEKLDNGNLLLEGEEESLSSGLDGEDASNEKFALEGAKSEVNITKSAEKGSVLHVTRDKLEQSISGNDVTFTKQQKHTQKNVHRDSNRVRSVDTLETTELNDPSSELSDILGKFSKYPTTRSSYAYDGSLSSYDGTDERFPIQHLDSFENTYTASNGDSEGRTKSGKGLINSYLFNGKHHVQNKVLEATRHGHRSSMRTMKDEFPPKIPFHRSSSHSVYERGGSSNQMHHKHYLNSRFLSPDSYEDTDQEKIKLLRMIQKLQNQLDTARYASGETNGRNKGNHISSYHRHDLHERRYFSHGMDYTLCNGRCIHGINWHQRHKFSKLPYSSEAPSSSHDSCFYCCSSKERHFSADILPHPQHGRCTDCCSYHHPYPCSPQWFTASKLPIYGAETKSDDQREKVSEARKYAREKQNLAKRHQKPVAGGAPFVTCHTCLKLLELPSDFPLYRRLKCGECSEVLKFSLQNGKHLVSFSPNSIEISSSGLNNQSKNVTSASHANYYQYSPAEAISCYDDYGISVSNSYYSSEVNPVSLTQFHPLHESRKFSSEIEAGTKPKSSSLHKLMGYSSPSQVVRGNVRNSYSFGKEGHDFVLN